MMIVRDIIINSSYNYYDESEVEYDESDNEL